MGAKFRGRGQKNKTLSHGGLFQIAISVLLFSGHLLSQQKLITLQRIDLALLPEIRVYFTVSDERDSSILGLIADDIEVTLDGVPQVISSLRSAIQGGEYLAVALLFDRSGSMKAALDQTKKAAINFVSRMSLNDQIAVISFDDRVRVDSPFSSDQASLERVIEAMTIGRDTALYDAIHEALILLEETGTKRQAVVVLSDGKDTRSKLGGEDVLKVATEKGVPLYTIGLGPAIQEESLVELSQNTGGQFFKAATTQDLLALYQKIAEKLKNQYILAFTSSFGRDERWHSLKIAEMSPEGKGFQAEKEFISTVSLGVSRELVSGLSQKRERENLFLYGGGGALIGLLLGILILSLIKLIRPEVRTLSLLGAGLMVLTFLLGGIGGVLVKFLG
jgi:VWFA-related protein